MVENPLVSVIIPNYNHEKYLKKRIDSILHQSYQNFEIIILDDCSSDGSKKIIEEYRWNDRVTHIVFNEVNSGSTFKQWQMGFDLADGEWIWIAESDDSCEPTLLAELISAVASEEEINLSFCQSIAINSENQILYTTISKKLAEIVDGKDFVKKFMLSANAIQNASMAIFRKKCISNIPLDYINMRFCGDWLFWVNVCIQGKVFISGKYLNYYLRHDNNVATAAIKEGVDFIEGNKIFNFISSKLSLATTEREFALKQIADKYFFQKQFFLNQEVEKIVLHSMIKLDPLITKLIKNRNRQKKSREIVSAVKRALTIPFIIAYYLKNKIEKTI
jgi:glycosyltransferase involved in cell wall biosynthesis